jgi:hypothetical protein
MLLAHQGGWDEALFVAVPLGIFTALLLVAKRRAEREVERAAERAAASDAETHAAPDTDASGRRAPTE